jgi:hypothetical protein
MELKTLKDLLKQHKLSPKHHAQIVALSEALAASKNPTQLAHNLVFNLVSHIAHGVELQNPSPEFFSTFIRQLEGSFKLGVMVGADLGTATRELRSEVKGRSGESFRQGAQTRSIGRGSKSTERRNPAQKEN